MLVDARSLSLADLRHGIGQVLNNRKQNRRTDRPIGKLRIYFNPGALNFQCKLDRLKAGRFCIWAGHSAQSSTMVGTGRANEAP